MFINENPEYIIPKGLNPLINKFCLTIGMLPSSYLLSLTYEEQVLCIGKYLDEQVIPALNNNAEAVAQLQQLFTDLKDYVENYFDNLDVQEEINNKLDEMVESGELQELLTQQYNELRSEVNTSLTNLYNTVNGEMSDLSTSLNSSFNTLQTNVNNDLDVQDANIEQIRSFTNNSINTQNLEIIEIRNRTNAVVSGAPIPVSSTSAMTDTSKIYVNTTDGNWYYYNGTAWTVGGTYQSSGGYEDLSSEISWLQSNVLDLKNDITSSTTQVNNKVFNISSLDNSLSFEDSSYYKYRRATVIGGHSYAIKTAIGNSKYDYCFTDNSDNLIQKGTIQSTIATYNINVVAPAGATRLYVNCLSTQSSNIYEYIKDTWYNNTLTLLNSNFYQLTDDGTYRFDKSLFLNRGLNNSGTFNGNTYRVSNYDIQVANFKTTLHAKTGFRFYVYTWGTVENPSDSPTRVGWFTDYTFNKNVRYKISIARTTEDQTEVANIQYFVSQIEIVSNLATKDYIDGKISNPYLFDLPSYYNDYLDTKINAIHDLEQAAGFNSVTYSFLTDYHVPANKKNSIPLLERLKDRTNASHLFYGGDSPSALGTLNDLKDYNYFVAKSFYQVFNENYHYIFGNHDYIIATGGSWGQGMEAITDGAVHSIYKKGIKNPNANYYYYDDEYNKIRHICIDYKNVQTSAFLQWFGDLLDNVPSDYLVAFYCHYPFVNVTGSENPPAYMITLGDWICAFNNHSSFTGDFVVNGLTVTVNKNYSSKLNKVLYGAFGHIHKDSLTVKNNVTFFSTTCDAMYQDDGYGRVQGTTDEQAFDVIHINKSTKTISLIRIGAGDNRTFTYGS